MSFSRRIKLSLLISSFLFVAVCNFSTPQPQSNPQAQSPSAQSKEIELSFQSIERDEGGGWGYPDDTETLIVVTAPEDISKLSSFISNEALQALENIDFNERVIVGVFRGIQGKGPYEVIVNKITRQNDIISVYVTFVEPDKIFAETVTSAYEIVAIEKPEQMDVDSLTFDLVINWEKASS